ncbi:MAG: septation protein A [Gammaproteobacteria bacterium]|nr:septation protein A [Rhodocyclaceae bacterium]MBU3910806.1 septation protein A [Gammaproteobacteria bacterium]MBU3988447.1 septation protein A [Gammaproteobacteria bacterium]MBU4006260.1 septation protein A [Gammaproteobacteria bacterium]MBU4097867.1 septation protein A [Gammaproteobacteria bacterium]
MKFFFDLFPVILFFVAYKLADIYTATTVAILATAGQVAWAYFRHGKVDKMLWAGFGLISVFGGITLLLHDPTYIKWKPTVLYWLFAGTLLGSALFFRKNLLRAMLANKITMPDLLWGRLNMAWVAFFVAMGVLNLYVAFNYSEADWVNFKLFGATGLTFTFIFAQGLMLSRFIEEKESA